MEHVEVLAEIQEQVRALRERVRKELVGKGRTIEENYSLTETLSLLGAALDTLAEADAYGGVVV